MTSKINGEPITEEEVEDFLAGKLGAHGELNPTEVAANYDKQSTKILREVTKAQIARLLFDDMLLALRENDLTRPSWAAEMTGKTEAHYVTEWMKLEEVETILDTNSPVHSDGDLTTRLGLLVRRDGERVQRADGPRGSARAA